jgi:hypothetical protein
VEDARLMSTKQAMASIELEVSIAWATPTLLEAGIVSRRRCYEGR